jgi:hypothetical protein
MTTRLELILRAALCRQLARRDPVNQAIWMAEAENWLRLSKEKPGGEATASQHWGSNRSPRCMTPRAENTDDK